jgi:hypothetical protein
METNKGDTLLKRKSFQPRENIWMHLSSWMIKIQELCSLTNTVMNITIGGANWL